MHQLDSLKKWLRSQKINFTMKLLFIFFFIEVLGIFETTNAQEKITGKYAGKNKAYALQLNDDSTYLCEHGSFHSYKYSTGLWHRASKGSIILNSSIKSTRPSLYVQEIATPDTFDKSILNFDINISGGNKLSDYKCEIIINDTVYDVIKSGYLMSSGLNVSTANKQINLKNYWFGYIRCDSLLTVKVNSIIRSLRLKFVLSPLEVNSTYFTNSVLETTPFLPKNGIGKFLVNINLSDSLFFYEVFSNKKVKVKRGKVSFFIKNLNKWEQIPKVRGSEKIFIRIKNY